MPSILKVPNDKKERSPSVRELAGFKTLICHLANVNQDRYEEWRDAMPDEYYYELVEALSTEKMQKILTRLM